MKIGDVVKVNAGRMSFLSDEAYKTFSGAVGRLVGVQANAFNVEFDPPLPGHGGYAQHHGVTHMYLMASELDPLPECDKVERSLARARANKLWPDYLAVLNDALFWECINERR